MGTRVKLFFCFQKCELLAYEEDESYDDDDPTVVVLNKGDLTSEEALKEKLIKEQGTRNYIVINIKDVQ